MDPVIYDVIIVGAGMAGLSAACTLVRNGVNNILVVEAQERIGGRVKSQSLRNLVFDHGAQWIHGQEGNSLYEFALQRGLLSGTPSFEGQGYFLTENGRLVDPTLVDEIGERVERILSDPKSTNEENMARALSVGVKQGGEWNPDLDALLRWHFNYQLVDNACYNLEELPVSAWSEYDECQGDYCQPVRDGFVSIINEMVQELHCGAIQCGRAVHKIEWESGDASSPYGRHVIVTLSGGEVLLCRHVIVTCSAGYLKKNARSMFAPQLPEQWLSALDGVGFGTVTKVLLLFDAPFWSGDCKGFQFAWTKFHKGENPWYNYLTGFDVVPCTSGFAGAALLGWVGSHGAEFLDRCGITDAEVGQQCVQLLRRFTGNENIPLPSLTVRTCWASDPYILGSYSYRTAPFDTILQDPIGPCLESNEVYPSLVFAGEALHASRYSTAHGAFDSGRDQATKIASFVADRSDSRSKPILRD